MYECMVNGLLIINLLNMTNLNAAMNIKSYAHKNPS